MPFSIHDRRQLGRTGLMVSPIGLGGVFIGDINTQWQGNPEKAVATVLAALNSGIRLIDTSAGYQSSKSEEAIGLALEEWRRQGGQRQKVVITTKTGTRTQPHDYSYDATMQSVEQSLKLLRTDHLDVVSIHDPLDFELDITLAPGGALEALKKLREQSVIRGIGLGVKQHEFHLRCIRTGEFDMCLTYRDYNLVNQSIREDILPLAGQYNVSVFNGTPIIRGLLGGKDPLEVVKQAPMDIRPPAFNPYSYTPEEIQLARRLWKFANQRGISLLALNLQYCMRELRIAATLLGAANENEIRADIEAISAEIPESVWQELQEEFGIGGF
jgi:aryl-alcohol dehydrogenase-like predicted oxidoreductase